METAETTETMETIRQYLRPAMMPHMLCPGCGHGIVLQALLRAIQRLALDPSRVAIVAGIGCSSRLAGYVDVCTLHATHGRAPAFATGLKLARPDLKVIVITGDGDGLAIGGNHLIHAARRNVDLLCLLFNNAIYGMTGGQVAPTTPTGGVATTAPAGSVEPPFDACALLTAAGATFVARGLAYQPRELSRLCEEGLRHEGFAFLEVISDCPEFYGRYNRMGRGPEMLLSQKRRVNPIAPLLARKAALHGARPAGPGTGWTTGVLHRSTRGEFTALVRGRSGGPA